MNARILGVDCTFRSPRIYLIPNETEDADEGGLEDSSGGEIQHPSDDRASSESTSEPEVAQQAEGPTMNATKNPWVAPSVVLGYTQGALLKLIDEFKSNNNRRHTLTSLLQQYLKIHHE